MQPIGILGGTFDPVHFGHLRPALEVYQELKLQEVRLIPSRVPPHRKPPVASAEQRLAMVRAAIADEPGLTVDTRELERPGPSYTVDTLASLRAEIGPAPLCLIVGADAFGSLHTWHRWKELIGLGHIVVIQRPGTILPTQGEVVDLLQGRYTQDRARLAESPSGWVFHLPVTQMGISGSHIRALLAAAKSPRYLLPDSVWEIIQQQGIYEGYQVSDEDQVTGIV
jgi:nicotinate-nucleotide adenylyltransferase